MTIILKSMILSGFKGVPVCLCVIITQGRVCVQGVIRAEKFLDETYFPCTDLLQLPAIATQIPTEKLDLSSSSIYFLYKGWRVPAEHHYNATHTLRHTHTQRAIIKCQFIFHMFLFESVWATQLQMEATWLKYLCYATQQAIYQ